MKKLFTVLFLVQLLAQLVTPAEVSAQDSTTFFLEEFDLVTTPALPVGWTDADALWETSSSVASTGSGLNNLTIAGGQPASVVTPSIDLSGLTAGTLEYLVRRTSTYDQDSLFVSASTDGGATFPIVLLDRGLALPATDGSYSAISVDMPAELIGQASVTLMFTALGGSTSGSNIRIDDVLISGDGDAPTPTNVIGFSTATGAVDGTTNTFEASVSLDFSNTEGLQGLQFAVDWDVDEVTLVDVVRGDAIADDIDWQLNFDARAGEMRGVLLGNQLVNLATGLYDPLLTLQFSVDPAATASEVVLTFTEAIGALAVRTGDDAGLTLGQATHTVSLDTDDSPTFEPDTRELDAGTIGVDSTATAQVTVSNTGGADLVVSELTSSNGLFTVDPLTATVPAGGSQVFTVSFTPSFTQFGDQDASLIFTHNAAGGSDTLSVAGKGVGGRGDVSIDGLVDALDIVLHVDFILERATPTSGQAISGDVFPFDAPDGVLDVRDLTVIAQAIVLGAWPDELPIPSEPVATRRPVLQASNLFSNDSLVLKTVDEGAEVLLYLDQQIPLRALQVSVRTGALTEPPTVVSTTFSGDVSSFHHFDEVEGTIRLVMFRADGGLIEAGRHVLARWSLSAGQQPVEPLYSVGVDASLNRLPIAFESGRITHSETDDETPGTLEVGAPFPNPFRVSQDGVLALPVTVAGTQHIRAEVFDILGRRIEVLQDGVLQAGQHQLQWAGKEQNGHEVASGLYFLRVDVAGDRVVRMVVVE